MSLGSGIGQYACIAPTLTWGLLRGKGLNLKQRIMLWNAKLNDLCWFMWCCDYFTCLYEVCELYDAYYVDDQEVLQKDMLHDF